MSRGILIGLALILLAGLCGLLVVVAASAALLFLSPPSTDAPAGPVTAAPPMPAPPDSLPTPDAASSTPPTDAAEEVAPEVRAMLREIEEQVRQIRGLQANGEFTLRFPTPEEYRAIVVEDFSQDYSVEEAADDARLLAALGLLPPGFDLYTLYLDLYTEQVLGSYDLDTDEMYVLLSSGRIGGVERQTYAHEYNHALQDQNFDPRGLGYSDEGCEEDSERCAAIRALIEGDATLLDTQWLEEFGAPQDYADINEFYADYSSPTFDRAPCYLRDDFYWPYDDGLKFVRSLHDAGGWAAVDEAYRNPPLSTEQIMHPEHYRSGDLPEMVPAPVLTDTLGAGWRQIDANAMGEWYTRLILLAPFRNLDQTSPDYCEVRPRLARQMAEAAAGWGGDAYTASYNDAAGQTVFVMLTTWDTGQDAREFAEAFAAYSEARWETRGERRGAGWCWVAGDYGVSCFWQRGTETLWVIAPDEQIAEKLFEQTSPFAGR